MARVDTKNKGMTSAARPCSTNQKPAGTGVKLFVLATAYICQAMPIGFCWVGLPVILRKAGAGLQCIGWLTMLYIPWALKFLWAPFVDRYYLPRVGRRRTWIFPLQWLSAILLGGLALFPPMSNPVIAFSLILVAKILLMSLLSHGGMYTRLPMLCDLGFSSSQVGGLLLRYAFPFGFAGTLISGFCIMRFGARAMIYAGGIAAAGVALLTVQIATAQHPSVKWIAAMLAGEQMLIGSIQVFVYTIITAASAGPQSGTNYAVLCSGSHIIFFSLAPVMALLADVSGYVLFYQALAAGCIVFMPLADMAFLKFNNTFSKKFVHNKKTDTPPGIEN